MGPVGLNMPKSALVKHIYERQFSCFPLLLSDAFLRAVFISSLKYTVHTAVTVACRSRLFVANTATNSQLRLRRQCGRAIHVFLQRVGIACYAERCINYSKSVRPSVRPSVCLSVTRWHCVKTTPATIMRSSP